MAPFLKSFRRSLPGRTQTRRYTEKRLVTPFGLFPKKLRGYWQAPLVYQWSIRVDFTGSGTGRELRDLKRMAASPGDFRYVSFVNSIWQDTRLISRCLF